MPDNPTYKAVSDYHGPHDPTHIREGQTYDRPADHPLVLAGVLVPVVKPADKTK